MKTTLNAILVLLSLSLNIASTSESKGCAEEAIVIYKVIFETFWTEDNFPKSYPHYRPPAQWSQLFGQSHNDSYTLFRIGEKASSGLQDLAEQGDLDDLNTSGLQDSRIFDQFNGKAIKSGAGSTEAEFFVGTNHSKVSAVSRLIPSPDWFVGVDGFELCRHGSWIDAVSVSADPLDAGTDEGFTFTAPNWRSEPQGVVYRVTSRYPPHPAGSFFYPEMEKLPAIANFRFVKIKEFSIKSMAKSGSAELKRLNPRKKIRLSTTTVKSIIGDNDLEPPQNDQGDGAVPALQEQKSEMPEGNASKLAQADSQMINKYHTFEILLNLAKGQSVNGRHHFPRHFRSRLLRARSDKEIDKACVVSEWSDWSPCSQSCGFGERTRRREIMRWPAEGGRPCPNILDREFCGSATLCRTSSYFNW